MQINIKKIVLVSLGIIAFVVSSFAQSASSIDTLKWKADGLRINLKDDLKHPSFSWPLSKIQYPITFNGGILESELMLRNETSGKNIQFQLVEPVLKNGRVQSAKLSFLTDLPTGTEKAFKLVSKKNLRSQPATEAGEGVKVIKIKDAYVISNGKIRIELPFAQNKPVAPIKRYGDAKQWLGYGKLGVELPFNRMSVQQLSAGPIEAAYRISYVFSDNKKYTVDLRLTAEMEYLELREQMTGFEAKDIALWQMVWNGLSLDHRYVPTRADQLDRKGKGYANINWEPMDGLPTTGTADRHPLVDYDQQNGKDGKLPFRISPYDNWLSWWRLPVAGFWSEKENLSIGVFIKDTEKWDDGLYALWGAKENLNIYFHWNKQILDYTFPLVNGSRSTALALYNHQKDIALVDNTNIPLVYLDELRRWHGWMPLDKVKNWVLNYQSQETGYPKYFKPENATTAMTLPNLENSLFHNLKVIGTSSERINGPTPVGSRVYYDLIVPAFDLKASEMSVAQYQKLRAWLLFVSYLYMDEALMPMRTMLSGHPNFLADIKGVPGLTAFLFPKHPASSEMSDHFEKAVQLNYNYHVRPEVPVWEAKGGRWTENIATYTWAALTPTIRTSFLLHHNFDGKNRILQPGISNYGNWLVNAITSPVANLANRRVYPPQGAHAHAYQGGPPNALRILGQELVHYDPLLAEQLFWYTKPEDSPFESTNEKNKAWSDILQGEWKNNTGTNPHLKSSKYTGYGFILRSAFGTNDEMFVNLQQIDEGPNYRWGRAAMGGNGVIYYYAKGRRYSHNGPEDVGDGPFGDTERVSNFGVKKAGGYRAIGPYRSVGRNDLTEPLYDFGFAQFASVLGNKDISETYKSRSVLQSSADYIAVYDEVVDAQTEGRFSWFTGVEDDFPVIHQLKPGITAKDADYKPSKSNYHKDADVLPTKGRYYDGKGSFLTIVTHKPEIQATATPFGAEIKKGDRKSDLIFRDSKTIQYNKDGVTFIGTSGIVQKSGNDYAAALFAGTSIAVPGIKIDLADQNQRAISLQTDGSGFKGVFQSRKPLTVNFSSLNSGLVFYLDGLVLKGRSLGAGRIQLDFPAGKHEWQWTNNGVVPAAPVITGTTVKSGSATISWVEVPGATSYQMEESRDGGTTWIRVQDQLKTSSTVLSGLKNETKIHVRLISQGKGGKSEPGNEYPIYVTALAPHPPEGLRLEMNNSDTRVTWGTILGAGSYRLYRRTAKTLDKSGFVKIYEGANRSFTDQKPLGNVTYEYVVTAINGNGESKYSTNANTNPSSFLNWQPKGKKGFRRDTEDHENGFLEFNPFIEDQKPVLIYPEIK